MQLTQEEKAELIRLTKKWAWIIVCVLGFITWELLKMIFAFIGAFFDSSHRGYGSDEGGMNFNTGDYDLNRESNDIYED